MTRVFFVVCIHNGVMIFPTTAAVYYSTEAEEGTAVSTSASSGSVIESDDTASAPVAPGFGDSTGGALALPEAEVVKEVDTSEEDAEAAKAVEAAKAAQAVKRVEENLTKGGLL